MNLNWLSPYRDFGLLFLRVGIGVMMFFHGWPKITGGQAVWVKLGGAMANLGITFQPMAWGLASALTETVGAILIVLGLWFRPAAVFLTFNFVVATILVYKTAEKFQDWSRPAEMLILFFSLIFIGAGKYSVDRS